MNILKRVTILIEGVVIKYFGPGTNQEVMEFHSYLSDRKLQDSSTVQNHMKHLVERLKSFAILKEGMTMNDVSDGCAAQYQSGSAFYFLSVLSYTEKSLCQE